jgi:hypothetical protein
VEPALATYTSTLAALQTQANQAYAQYQAALAAAGCPPGASGPLQFVAVEEPPPDRASRLHLEHTLYSQLLRRVEQLLGHYRVSDHPGQPLPTLDLKSLNQQRWKEAEQRVRTRAAVNDRVAEIVQNYDAEVRRPMSSRPGDQTFSSGSLGRNKELIRKTYERVFRSIEAYENEIMVEYWLMSPGESIDWEKLRRDAGVGGVDLLPRPPRELPGLP